MTDSWVASFSLPHRGGTSVRLILFHFVLETVMDLEIAT